MNMEPGKSLHTSLAASSASSRLKRNLRPILLLVVPALVLAAAAWLWLQGGRFVGTENAYVKAHIVQVAAEIPGRVAEVRVKDHATVKKGDVLVALDQAPYQLALRKAEAELDSARALVEMLKASYREARADLQEADSKFEFLDAQAKRQQDLAKRGVTPTVKVEQAESEAAQARERVLALRQKIERAKAALGGEPEQNTDLYAAVREKIALRDRAKLDFDYTEVKAADSGIVVNVKVRPGEQVKALTPIFAIISEERAWVEANFKETDLTNVVPGQKATVVLDIYPDITWEAEVMSISPATGAEFALLPPQNASGNWVKVVQRLPVRVKLMPRPGEPALRAGMTATVSIDTERKRSIAGLFGGSARASAEGQAGARPGTK
jgi:membrane fusion protein (multidrug efflux system)